MQHVRCTCGARAVHVRCTCGARAVHVRCTCGARAVHVRCTCGARAVHVRCTCGARTTPGHLQSGPGRTCVVGVRRRLEKLRHLASVRLTCMTSKEQIHALVTPKIWNKLPSVIKDAQSLESFKIAMRKHYQ